MGIGLGVVDLDVTDLALVVEDREEPGVDEALVRSKIQALVAGQDFLMELRVDSYRIGFHQVASCSVVAFTLNALNLSE